MSFNKELQAQRKRVEALKYLKEKGCVDIDQLLSRGKVIESKKTCTDNTLDLLLKSRAENGSKESSLRETLLRQQNHLRVEVPKDVNGWVKINSKDNGKCYYWNRKTNETTWEAPLEFSAENLLNDTKKNNSKAQIPEDLIEKVHSATGQIFYGENFE